MMRETLKRRIIALSIIIDYANGRLTLRCWVVRLPGASRVA